MFDHDEQHAAESHITRREAMEKIGRLGIYVPATLAVLSAATRAFAQSADFLSVSGTLLCRGEPEVGLHVALRLDSPTNPIVDDDITDENGAFSVQTAVTGTGMAILTPYDSSDLLVSGPYPGIFSGVTREICGPAAHSESWG